MKQILVSEELLRQVLDALCAAMEFDAGDAESEVFDAATALREALEQPAVEPVAAQHRFRHPQKTEPDWSPWQQCDVRNRPPYEIDTQGWEVEYRPLYTAPQKQQPVARVIWPSAAGLPSIEWLVDTSRVTSGMVLYAAPQAQQPRYTPSDNEGSEP